MTDQVSPEYAAAAAARSAEIDRMVSAASARAETYPTTQTRAAVKVEISPETGAYEVHGTVEPAERIADTGANHDALIANMTGELANIEAQLAENIHDSRTGAATGPRYIGAERVQREMIAAQLRESIEYQKHCAAQIERQRADDKAAAAVRATEELRIHNFTGGDPRREELVREAMLKAEAETLAKALLAERYERELQR